MAERLTTVGRSLLASHQGNGTHLQVDKFVLAYIPGQNPSTEIDPASGLPPANQIVHEQAVTKSGYMSPDMVNYSLYMDDTVGPFTFNTIYTVATAENNAVLQIITVPDTPKIATDQGGSIRGQPMVRNAVLVYDDAAAITNITVEAAAWQFTYEKASTETYGITKEATKEQTLAGLPKGLFVSPFGLAEWWEQVKNVFAAKDHTHTGEQVDAATEGNRGTVRRATQGVVDSRNNDTDYITPKKMGFGFRYSFGTNGYIFLPDWLGGFGFQWLINLSTGTSNPVVGFPVVFPNQLFFAIPIDYSSAGGSSVAGMAWDPQSSNTSAAQIRTKSTSYSPSFHLLVLGR